MTLGSSKSANGHILESRIRGHIIFYKYSLCKSAIVNNGDQSNNLPQFPSSCYFATKFLPNDSVKIKLNFE